MTLYWRRVIYYQSIKISISFKYRPIGLTYLHVHLMKNTRNYTWSCDFSTRLEQSKWDNHDNACNAAIAWSYLKRLRLFFEWLSVTCSLLEPQFRKYFRFSRCPYAHFIVRLHAFNYLNYTGPLVPYLLHNNKAGSVDG